MEDTNNPPSKPADARKATEEQRIEQDQLEHKDEDPDAPGRHQSRNQVADET